MMKQICRKIAKRIAGVLVATLVVSICMANVIVLNAEEASIDIRDVTFQMTDIRDSSKVSSFNGNDGKQAIIVYGGAQCYNTLNALGYLNEVVENVDMSKLNIYVFEIKGTDKATILTNMGTASAKIMLDSNGSSEAYNTLYSRCYWGTVNGGFTMPLILYKGTEGTIYSYTTGSTSLTEIVENIEAGGLDVDIDISIVGLKVKGQSLYQEAYEVLDMMNREREAAGVSPLVMDEELLQAAMQRAAECTLYYSHTRPDGSSCVTVSDRMSGENIALGYWTSEMVMDAWMNSSGHKANILEESYQSVGVGCFYSNGGYTWTQCFGREAAVGIAQPADANDVYTIKANVQNVMPTLLVEEGTITVGNTEQLVISATQLTNWENFVEPDSYEWSSDSDAATVDSNGVITAVKKGTAIITGRNKVCPTNVLTYTVTVPEYNPFGDVKTGDWHYPYVVFAYENNLMGGKGTMPDGSLKFDPSNTITRAEFVQMLYSKEGKPTVTYEARFTDVPDDKWFTDAILWAAENEIVGGKKADYFDVNGNITRQEIALILYKYAMFKNYDLTAAENTDLSGFGDVQAVSTWAANGMKWAVGNNIIGGKTENGKTVLSPGGKAIRAEAATMMKGFMAAFEGENVE